MEESRRLAMRRRHAGRISHCTCGKDVAGNGGRAAHKAMHVRKSENFYYMTTTEYDRRKMASHTQGERG